MNTMNAQWECVIYMPNWATKRSTKHAQKQQVNSSKVDQKPKQESSMHALNFKPLQKQHFPTDWTVAENPTQTGTYIIHFDSSF